MISIFKKRGGSIFVKGYTYSHISENAFLIPIDIGVVPLLLIVAIIIIIIIAIIGGRGKECLNYNSRLTELLAIKKKDDYAKAISRIRARPSFALLRSALICLRGTKTTVRGSWD